MVIERHASNRPTPFQAQPSTSTTPTDNPTTPTDFISIPTYNSKVLFISNIYDSIQAIVVSESLVVIRKFDFLEDSFYVFGCSKCVDINLAFTTTLKVASTTKHTENVKCDHILGAIGSLLYYYGRWQSQISERELQRILSEYCYLQTNEQNEFYNELHKEYFGVVTSEYGCLLFKFKTNKWQCMTCNTAARRCKHGKSVELPEGEIVTVQEATSPKTSKTLVLSTFQISGKTSLFIGTIISN